MTTSNQTKPLFRKRFSGGLITLGLCLLWSLVVLYPNPTLLPRAIANAYDPKIDPEAVRHWADALPDDPAYIEKYVETELLPYEVPWESYGVPWYYPTTREVVEQGSADCQGRMLVFASILEAKGIPYTLRASIDHIWVEYETKKETRSENAAIAVMDDGNLTVPQKWDWRASYEVEKEYFWDTAPLGRKLLLFGGLAVIVLRRRIARTARRLRQAFQPANQPSLVDRLLTSVAVWEAEGRITAVEADDLRARLAAEDFSELAPHLGVHVACGLLLPFPFASIARACWTGWMLLSTTLRWAVRRTDRTAVRRAWKIHHPVVAVIAAVPVIGSLAYLFPMLRTGQGLLVRLAAHTSLSQMPWRIYERTGSYRLLMIGRPALNAGLKSSNSD